MRSSNQVEDESSCFRVKLWQDSIVEYRRTVRPNLTEEAWLGSLLPVDAQYQAAISEWGVYRNQRMVSNHKNLNKLKNALHKFLLALYEKISTLDVLIALPVQTVNDHICGCY